MDVFSPLIEEAARWIWIDATLRILWNTVGLIALLGTGAALIALGIFAIRNPPAKKRSKP